MEKKRIIELDAKIDSLSVVLTFVEDLLSEFGCPQSVITEMDIAVEEIYVNIASYAYEGQEGKARIEAEIINDDNAIRVVLTDWGIPYNPLEKTDPDITLSAMERAIGGLGIYMVKQSMDNVEYFRKDDTNNLVLEKSFSEDLVE